MTDVLSDIPDSNRAASTCFGRLEHSPYSLRQKLLRGLWDVVWLMFFRYSPRFCQAWRRFLLRCFGASIARDAHTHPSTRIWAPWNLRMEKCSTLSHHVDCYCVAPVTLSEYAIISQYSYLCTATHDFEQRGRPLVSKPITIGAGAWVCADVFVGPGVTVGEGAVVGARAAVFKDVEPWTIVGGNPSRFIRMRKKLAKGEEARQA